MHGSCSKIHEGSASASTSADYPFIDYHSPFCGIKKSTNAYIKYTHITYMHTYRKRIT